MSEKERPLALIVDDESDIRELLELTLTRMAVDTRSAADLRQAREHLAVERFDLCLTDMRLPDGSGIDLVREIQQYHAQMPVAVITAHGSMDSAIEALKAGAFDFVTKPVELQDLRDLVHTALRLRGSRPAPQEDAPRLLGDSRAIRQIRKTIHKLARSQAPVYISGESGTGKELVARLIHDEGPRCDHPFIAINCGAIPEELIESELFGHKKGSFTGAGSEKEGLFQAARGGTLFLDEVAELPLHMQVKLLRAIQEKAVRPIGATQEIRTDVRILSATHQDLGRLVREGRFREDLFYRINVIELHIPPLRQRREDIPLLARHIVARLAAGMGCPEPALFPAAIKWLSAQRYSGNVRELENILERTLTLSEGACITPDDLELTAAPGAPAAPEPPRSDLTSAPLESYLQDVEKEAILHALAQTRHNKTRAAELLGISFRALRYRLQKLGIE